jgi:glycosyltransferase involved in cell wall biosynthesis
LTIMADRKNIWLIVIGEPIPIEPQSRALRTRILARHLATLGHSVTWWTSNFNHFTKTHHPVEQTECDSNEGYSLRFLRGRAYRRNLSVARFLNHREIAQDFKAQAAQLASPDIIVCCFPSIELTREAVKFAKRRAVPVVVDIRDLWPDEMRSRIPKTLRGIGSLLLAPMERQVRTSMRLADSIVGVSQAYLDWGLAKAGRNKGDNDCVVPLGYPDSAESRAMRHAKKIHPKSRPLNFFFSGSFNNSVDLGSLIGAFRGLRDQPISATLCGDGDNFVRWQALAADDPRIEFSGWVQADEIRRLAAQADVGVVCYRPESLVAMPNKLFEYMSFGLPIINSIPGEAAALVEDRGIGLNYVSGSADGLRGAILAMLASSPQRAQMAEASGRCFEQDFSADAVYQHFSKVIFDVMEAHRQTPSICEERHGLENEIRNH